MQFCARTVDRGAFAPSHGRRTIVAMNAKLAMRVARSGRRGTGPMKKRRKYTEEFKRDAVKLVNRGTRTVEEVAKRMPSGTLVPFWCTPGQVQALAHWPRRSIGSGCPRVADSSSVKGGIFRRDLV